MKQASRWALTWGAGPAHRPPFHYPDEETQTSNPNFLTDSKEREKKREVEHKNKAVEKIDKTMPKTIERHHDDCGDSLQCLGNSFICKCCEDCSSSSEGEDGVAVFSFQEYVDRPSGGFGVITLDKSYKKIFAQEGGTDVGVAMGIIGVTTIDSIDKIVGLKIMIVLTKVLMMTLFLLEAVVMIPTAVMIMCLIILLQLNLVIKVII